jgi:hypothetical protein
MFHPCRRHRYNLRVRLLVTGLWLLAALCWLPWLALLVRLGVELALDGPWVYELARRTLIGIWPKAGMGLWPLDRLLLWQVISWYPISAVLGMALAAVGWRIYWREQDGRLTRPAWLVALSVALPPLAPLLMYGDARSRHWRKERELEDSVEDARERLTETADI